MFSKLKSKRWNYQLGDIVSASQKAVRRNNKELLINSVVELDIGIVTTKGKDTGYGAVAWKRLLTCCVEDIGPASPNLVIQIY